MTGESVALDLYCPHCHGAVEFQFVDWVNESDLVEQAWTCPFCARVHRMGFPGTLVWVTRRSTSDVDCSPEAMRERLREKRERLKTSQS